MRLSLVLALSLRGSPAADARRPAPPCSSIGPAVAIPKALKLAGLSKDDVDFYEINEAFASQAVYSVKEVGLPFDKVNLNGGAIAIGASEPSLSCTCARAQS